MEIRVKLENLDGVLGKLTKDIDLGSVMNKNAESIKKEAQRLCPVDTGVLQKSIKAQVERNGTNSVEASVYTNVHYAPYVEFGTGRRGSGSYPYSDDISYGDIAGQTAQPFLYPALKLGTNQLIEDIKEKL